MKASKPSSFDEIRRHKPKKGTSIGYGTIKRSSMNKRRKHGFKSYRGQGR